MRDAIHAEIEAAAEAFEETIDNEPQPLELKPMHTADLAEVYKEMNRAKLIEIADAYLPLTIAGIEDKAGYSKVYDALQDVKAIRVKTDKVRKATNEKAQEWIRTNNEEAKHLTGILAPVEKHLQAERDRYEAQVEAIKAEKQRIADERNQGRVNALLAVGAEIPLSEVVLMSDETFTSYLALATKSFNDTVAQVAAEAEAERVRLEAEAAEKARILAEEAAAREAERAALAKEREAIEAERAANARAAAQLKAEQDQLAARRSAVEQAARDEQIRKDAQVKAEAEAERKRIEAEVEKARQLASIARAVEIEAALELSRKAKEEEEAEARAAARPDAEKLVEFAHFLEGKAPPEMATPAGQSAAKDIKALLIKLTHYARERAAGLTK